METEEIDINAVIIETLSLVEHHLELKNIQIVKELSEVPSIRHSFVELSQVLTNLFMNAQDAISANDAEVGKIIISTAVADDKISLSPSKKTFILLIFLFLIIPLHQDLVIQNLVFKDLKYYIPLNQANIFFTIFCLYFFYNLINFSDGANGITISLSIYWLLIFVFFGSINKLYIYSLIAPLVLILIFNLKNKIFLGNSGSSLLSITLASLFIINYNIDNSIKSDEIVLLMFIPAIDAIRVTIDRVIDGNSPLQPDKKHFHHLMLKKFKLINRFLISLHFFPATILIKLC